MTRKPATWFLVASGLLGLVGLGALAYRLVEGLKVTWLSSSVPWGMWVAFYIYFIGLSAGSFLFSTLIYVFGRTSLEKAGRMALVSAVLALLAGLLFVWVDLGHPERFLNVFIHWNPTSVLAWEILFYLFYIACVAAELWYLMRCDLAVFRDRARGLARAAYGVLALGWQCPITRERFEACHRQSLRVTAVLGAIGIPLAIAVHGGTGAIFAVVKARPYWYSPIFPIIFLVSALVSGAGLLTFLYAFFGDRQAPDHPGIVRELAGWLVLFLSIDVLLIVADLLVGLYGGIPDHVAVWRQIMAGPYWYMFWIGQLGLAVLVPVVLFLVRRDSPFWMGVAGLSVVVGIVCVRFNLVIPAFVTPPIPHLDKAFHGLRLNFAYFPSPLEWVSSIGLISLVVFLFTLAYWWLPIFEVPHRFAGEEGAA